MSGTTSGGAFDFEDWSDLFVQQLEDRLRELGTREPRCSVPGCDETNPFALVGVHPQILCYEHLLDRRGRRWTENHHWSGHHNDPFATAVPGNDHRILSALQSHWPRETLRNPDGSPLLRAAAALRGWFDLLWLVMYRALGWIPPFLEWLDPVLCEHVSERWWDELGRSEQ